MVVPKSPAYAQIAGAQAHYGLYAACIPCIVGALFGSSRFLSTGPVAMTSLLTTASLAAGGMNQLDASGVKTLCNMIERLEQNRITLALCGVKKQVQDVMDRTGLAERIGRENLFATDGAAVEALVAGAEGRLAPAPDKVRKRPRLCPSAPGRGEAWSGTRGNGARASASSRLPGIRIRGTSELSAHRGRLG